MNIANKITRNAYLYPHKKAVLLARKQGKDIIYDSLTFKEVESFIDQYALNLENLGIKKGDKVLLLTPPTVSFSPLVFALFKMGAVVVLMDKGAGLLKLFASIRQVAPKVLIGSFPVFLLRFLYRAPFKSVSLLLNKGKYKFPGTVRLETPRKKSDLHYKERVMSKYDPAAILFTSGATGDPKGVIYTHFMLLKQVELLQKMFNLTEKDLDVAAFPLFSLFTLSMGITSVLPPMDFSQPAKADPATMVRLIEELEATFLTGSPAVWQKVANYCDRKKITFSSVRVLATFGAPVSIDLHKKFNNILISGTTYTPYGATESLPVSNISGKEILHETASLTQKGRGVCVGHASFEMEIKIIRPTKEPIDELTQAKMLTPYQVGEIIVRGPVVSASYYNMPEKNATSKIMDDNTFWHRMGDMGYLDLQGRLWYCGRKSHLVFTQNKVL
ncbi:MAG: AMP-binding protein, partial [Halobacteriovoraceae bacterium]|nr:AMP-binding protein [Halobacteriovoraceae bacterium]